MSRSSWLRQAYIPHVWMRRRARALSLELVLSNVSSSKYVAALGKVHDSLVALVLRPLIGHPRHVGVPRLVSRRARRRQMRAWSGGRTPASTRSARALRVPCQVGLQQPRLEVRMRGQPRRSWVARAKGRRMQSSVAVQNRACISRPAVLIQLHISCVGGGLGCTSWAQPAPFASSNQPQLCKASLPDSADMMPDSAVRHHVP